MTPQSTQNDYVFRGVTQLDRVMRERRAGSEAAFLLPYLKPGMSLIDFGCGQGTITAGLAQAVAPGKTLGFDLQADHIQRARELSTRQGLANLTFEVGDVFQPPCAPASFDVAFAHVVLSHLSDPERCLREMHSVLKPGGIAAIRDRGGGYVVSGTNSDAVRAQYEVLIKVIDAAGQNPYGSQTIGEVLNRLCREAGFDQPTVGAGWLIRSTSSMAEAGLLSGLPDQLAERAIELGLTTRAEIAEQDAKRAEWLADPDGYLASAWFEVIARKP